jgi:hypothetical protein
VVSSEEIGVCAVISPAQVDDGFDRFWVAYPRHKAKKDARKAWTQLAPNADLIDKILTALAWQKTSAQWVKDGGEFIPYPATWLRAERWDDEPFCTRPVLGKTTSKIVAMLAEIHREES